ncbi:MAG: HDOD domain-containing protein [Gammaproteobacteria bacterium]|nr:HDOD domain-containing protein [Gammaproteobacteria bacterium]
MDDIYIGRQPIYDANLHVVAYELLFRSGKVSNEANVINGDHATTNVIINAITEIGMDQLVGPHQAFINLTRNHIIQMADRPLPELKDRLVLEILEDIKAEKDIVEAVTKLAGDGFTLALDDFIYDQSLQPLIDISKIIKIDLMALSVNELEEHVKKLTDGKHKLLAEKVETQEEYDRCKALGFDYYQGYFFSKPQIIKGQSLPANKLAIIKLMAELLDQDSSNEELAAIIAQDITMSVRVLRYINSAQFGFSKEVDSIQQAIMMLGRITIRNLANLVAMSQVENKPHELLIISMTRAKMAENIAILVKNNKEACFTTGLFSIIDALMNQEMEILIEGLPLTEKIRAALIRREGELGEILNCVIAYEGGDWKNAHYDKLSVNEIRECYLDALNWASSSGFLLKA